VQLGSLTFNNAGTTLTVTPSNGYGLDFTGGAILNQSYTTFSVGSNGATTSNVVPSLILSGLVSGTIPSGAFTKTGTGTMLLTDASNTFTGDIVIGTGGAGTTSFGALAFTSAGALGNTANTITLNGGTGAGAAAVLEATSATTAPYVDTYNTPASTIVLGNTINFWGAAANNIIAVANNTTLQLNAPFGSLERRLFAKNDTGTLILTANNDAWSGLIIDQ
jgi:autotransporter-associated beta strand protein